MEIRVTVQEVQREYIAVNRVEAETSAKQARAINGMVPWALDCTLSVPSILVYVETDETMLRSGDSSNGSNGTVIDSMITDTDNVNKTVSGFEKADIGTTKTTICTTVHQGKALIGAARS